MGKEKFIMNAVKIIFQSSRPISWINTAFPFVAGYIFLSHSFDWTLVIGGLYFLIPYNLLMYGVNDVYDYESDLRNPRKGGIEGALVPPKLHKTILKAAAILNVPFIVYLLINGSVVTNILLVFIIFMALAYSVPGLRFKERPVLDSITSSFHFVGPLLYAISLIGWSSSFIPYIAAFFAWGMASHAFGAVQDITADRKAHIHSIATRFGARTTSRFALTLYAISSLVLLLQGGLAIFVGIALLLYVGMVAPYSNLQDKDAEEANNGWRHFLKINQLTGFVVTVVLILLY